MTTDHAIAIARYINDEETLFELTAFTDTLAKTSNPLIHALLTPVIQGLCAKIERSTSC